MKGLYYKTIYIYILYSRKANLLQEAVRGGSCVYRCYSYVKRIGILLLYGYGRDRTPTWTVGIY